MPRKAYLAPHLSLDAIREKYQKTDEPVEKRRWQILWKIALGWTVKNTAIAVGVSYQYAHKVLAQYNQEGASGLKNKRKNRKTHKRGKDPLLNEEQFESLTERLKERPADGGIWTGPKVARWIEKETGREKVWNQRGWDYLKKCNYSWQRPRPKHREGDAKAQEEFKRNLPLKVKEIEKLYPESKIEVYFFDEHRVGLQPILCRVWAEVGSQPIALIKPRYEWLYVYSFVNPKTGKTYWYLLPRVNVKWFNLALETFAQEVGVSPDKKVIIVLDNAGWHRSKKVNCPEGIFLEFLPPYSPELQPAERLWKLVDEALANQNFETLDDLEDRLVERCCVLQTMSHEICNLTNYHWLDFA